MRVGVCLAGLLGLLSPSLAHGDPPIPASAAPPTLSLLKVIEAHAIRTRALVFDAGGTILVSGGSDRRLRIWDAKTLRLLSTWAAPARENYEP